MQQPYFLESLPLPESVSVTGLYDSIDVTIYQAALRNLLQYFGQNPFFSLGVWTTNTKPVVDSTFEVGSELRDLHPGLQPTQKDLLGGT